jgi:hypothetical protein
MFKGKYTPESAVSMLRIEPLSRVVAKIWDNKFGKEKGCEVGRLIKQRNVSKREIPLLQRTEAHNWHSVLC